MKTFFTFIFLLFTMNIFAVLPVDSTGVEMVNGQYFIRHQVTTGEGWFAIARRYGISYGELRLANNGKEDKLVVGQIVLVPGKAKINDPRFQKNYPAKPKVAVESTPRIAAPVKTKQAVTHKVMPSETLYSISRKYGVKVDDLKSWNHLSDNSIKLGQELIVGSGDHINATRPEPVSEKKPDETIPDAKKEEIKKEETPVEKIVVEKPKKEISKAEAAPVVATPEIPSKADDKSESNYTFSSGRKEMIEVGMGSWIEDEESNPNKYFALHRTAPPNTVIRVTNKENNKSLFVKVIGRLLETGGNEGLIIKVSKASAEKLGVTEKTFRAELIYGVSVD